MVLLHNVKVSLLVWRTRYTDTFRNAVDCRFELVLEVQRWTRARSQCLPGDPKIIHCESKKTRHLTLAHNFTKYLPIFKILSLLDSVGNL